MARKGIKLVWAGWCREKEEDVIGFNCQQYKKWKPTFDVGTRMLIYETADAELRGGDDVRGEKAIVGEVEVTELLGDRPELAPTPQHTCLVRVKIIHPRSDVILPVSQLHTIKGLKDFPIPQSTWHPLDDQQYDAILERWLAKKGD